MVVMDPIVKTLKKTDLARDLFTEPMIIGVRLSMNRHQTVADNTGSLRIVPSMWEVRIAGRKDDHK